MKKRIGAIILGIGMLVLSIGCGNNSEVRNIKEDTASNVENTDKKSVADVVKIGFVDVTGSGKLSGTLGIARDKGYVDEELEKIGVKVEFVPMTGAGPAINEALASKNLDIGALGDVPAIIGKAAGIDTELISTAGLNNGASIVIPLSSNIKSVNDLKGKKIATQKGAFMHKVLIDILEANGLTINDIEFVNMNAQNSADALVSGNVDGVVVGGVPLAKLILNSNGKTLVDFRDNLKLNTASYTIVRTEFAKENPEIIKAIVKALVRAKDLSLSDTTANLVQWQNAGNSKETFEYLYPKNDCVDKIEFTQDIINNGKSTVEFLKKNELIKNDVDIEKWINKSYYEATK